MHCIAFNVCCIRFVRSSKTINLLQEGGILFVSILLVYCIQLRHFVEHPQENIFPPFKPADDFEDFSLFVTVYQFNKSYILISHFATFQTCKAQRNINII